MMRVSFSRVVWRVSRGCGWARRAGAGACVALAFALGSPRASAQLIDISPESAAYKTMSLRATVTMPSAPAAESANLLHIAIASNAIDLEVAPDGSLFALWNGSASGRAASAPGALVPGATHEIIVTYDATSLILSYRCGVTSGVHVWVDGVCVLRDLKLLTAASGISSATFGSDAIAVDSVAPEYGRVNGGDFFFFKAASDAIFFVTSSNTSFVPADETFWLGERCYATDSLETRNLPAGISRFSYALDATLPETGDGTFITFTVAQGATTNTVAITREGDKFYRSWHNTTKTNKAAIAAAVSGRHFFRVTYDATGGTCFYIDGECVSAESAIKWNGSTVVSLVLGQFKGEAWLHAANLVSITAAVAPASAMDGLVDWSPALTRADAEVQRWAFERIGRRAPDYAPGVVRVNGERLADADALNALYFFNRGETDADFDFNIAEARFTGADTFALALDTGADALANGSLSLLGKAGLDLAWTRLETRRVADFAPGEVGAFEVATEGAAQAFFSVRAELGDPVPGKPLAAWSPSADATANPVMTGAGAADLAQFTLAGAVRDLGAEGRSRLTLTLRGDELREGDEYTLTIGAAALTAALAVDAATGEGRLVFEGLPEFAAGATATLRGPAPSVPTTRTVTGAAIDGRAVAHFAKMLANRPATEFPGAVCYAENSFRIPALAADAAGKVVLAAYDCRYDGGDLGQEKVSGHYAQIDTANNISTDGGLTWTQCALGIDVPNHTDKTANPLFDIGDPAMLYDPATETFWLMAITGGGLIKGNASNDCVLYTRGAGVEDEWREWTGGPAGNTRSVKAMLLDAKKWNPVKGILQGPGHGIVLRMQCGAYPAGTLVFPMQYFGNNNYNARCFAAYSTDHGATWTPSALTTSSVNAQENCIAQLDDGSLIMMCKGGSAYDQPGARHFFRSTDGENWSQLSDYTPTAYVQGSCLRIGTHADGTSRYVMAMCGSPGSGNRDHLRLIFGRDLTADPAHRAADTEGVAWDCGEMMIHKASTGGMGYNSLCLLDGGATLGVLYETNKHIYFERIPLAPHLGKE